MKTDLTEVVFLLDRSGSMSGLETDTIGGFNGFMKRQLEYKGNTHVTAVLFDDQYELLYDGVDANGVSLTSEQYYTKGGTALLDAIGKTILTIGQRLSATAHDKKPNKVIVVITTDGMENASIEFTYEQVRNMIEHQREKYSWEFIFMGANIDAVKEAESIGIGSENAYEFEASEVGVVEMYHRAYEAVSEKRIKS